MDLIDWWINLEPLSVEEKKLLTSSRNDEFIDKIFTVSLTSEFIKRLPNCNLSNEYQVRVDNCATNLIQSLFNTYIDDDTLVIYTENEHYKIKGILDAFKNKLVLSYNDILKLNMSKIASQLSKFKKVFVYIIGTQLSSGEITSQYFFIKLKELLNTYKCQYKLILDDVHGMFFVPRDYSIFDYIIGTTHALIPSYHMGILIGKENMDKFGRIQYQWEDEYLRALDVLLKRKEKIYQFKYIMEQSLAKIISEGKCHLLTQTAPHLFTLKTDQLQYNQEFKDELDKYGIRLEGVNEELKYILCRVSQFIINPNILKEGIETLNIVLNYMYE